jgi:tripartite-type tricarboxylate transporter receptor subunit TctC
MPILTRRATGMLLAGAALAGQARAQGSFPDRPLRIVVPVPPGGVGDQAARHTAQQFQADLGQPVVVENRPGAFGFSTSRTISHKTPKGDPTPTLKAQEDELTSIAMGLR